MFLKKRNIYLLIAALLLSALVFGFNALIYPRVLPQPAINLLPDVVVPQSGQKVLVFSPHPDDETIGTGGYIAQARENGADVRIILITDGNRHHNEIVRYAEFLKATGILNVSQDNLVFLNFPDGRLSKQDPALLYNQFKKQIDDYNPDIVLYPNTRDFHPDHWTAGRITYNVLKNESPKRIAYQYLVHYEVYYPQPKKFVPNSYLLPPVRLAKFNYRWQKFMLSDAIEQRKKEAIDSYRSQQTNLNLKELLYASIRKNELFLAP